MTTEDLIKAKERSCEVLEKLKENIREKAKTKAWDNPVKSREILEKGHRICTKIDEKIRLIKGQNRPIDLFEEMDDDAFSEKIFEMILIELSRPKQKTE